MYCKIIYYILYYINTIVICNVLQDKYKLDYLTMWHYISELFKIIIMCNKIIDTIERIFYHIITVRKKNKTKQKDIYFIKILRAIKIYVCGLQP
ncbi:hypothetical protein PFNF135_06216 [Plasmodium falciparum NF135/5.C10]|uniref:Uncharacterized protein n=2 Tax=Plasmodium falciparum TaxID=5833 RepID=A0A024WWB5_PLAFA|nr:hypothetical protein PFNF135_06216 [Plasmodium falciparum NF135/5.C10]ETW51549.1 hypothetical protein PFMALIP_00387 [Plasmodium falciparum MaliPS096_E11]